MVWERIYGPYPSRTWRKHLKWVLDLSSIELVTHYGFEILTLWVPGSVLCGSFLYDFGDVYSAFYHLLLSPCFWLDLIPSVCHWHLGFCGLLRSCKYIHHDIPMHADFLLLGWMDRRICWKVYRHQHLLLVPGRDWNHYWSDHHFSAYPFTSRSEIELEQKNTDSVYVFHWLSVSNPLVNILLDSRPQNPN